MNSKYREVPRYPASANSNNLARFQGVSSAAIAAREVEQARIRALDAQLGLTPCAWLAIGALFIAVLFDASAWATTGWGYSEENGVFTQVGLWQICTGTMEPAPKSRLEVDEDGEEVEHEEFVPVVECIFPTSVPQDWIHKALVMEIMGGFCAAALFVCLIVLVASMKCSFVQSRTMVITLIPLAFLAALMNLIGVLTIALNLFTINCRPSYSIALDTLGMVFFSIGGACALMEIQNCFRVEEDPDPTPPVVQNRHPAVGLAFLAS